MIDECSLNLYVKVIHQNAISTAIRLGAPLI